MNLIFINDFQVGKSRFVQKISVYFNVKIKHFCHRFLLFTF